MVVKGLQARLADNETVLAAGGYLFEFERRGYLKAGAFVPEVVLEHPELVEQLSEEFVHAGTDVVLAFQYYAHRSKLSVIGRESDLDAINHKALQIASKVARKHGKLFAGNLCNTTSYDASKAEKIEETAAIFKASLSTYKLILKLELRADSDFAKFSVDETFASLLVYAYHQFAWFDKKTRRYFKENLILLQEWAKLKEQVEFINQYGADLIVVESIEDLGEAKLALEAVLKYGNGTPAVVTMYATSLAKSVGGKSYADCCHELESMGASVVGLNCSVGPQTIVELLKPVRYACKGPIAALPVPYRTDITMPSFQSLKLPDGRKAFPKDLDYYCSPQSDIKQFGKSCLELGIQYLGICCGNSSRYFRALAESIGRVVPASRYSANMDEHYLFGQQNLNKEYYDKLRESYT